MSFFLHLKYVIPGALLVLLLASALASSSGSLLELSGIGSLRDAGNSWQLLTEAAAVAPRYQNLAMQTQSNFIIVTLQKEEPKKSSELFSGYFYKGIE